MAAILGLDAKLYYLSTGTRAAWPATGDPTNLVEITDARDVTINLSASEADVTTRGSGGWRATLQAVKDATLDFELVADTGDTILAAIKDAFINGTGIAMAALDGASATAGTTGLWADMEVVSFTRNEPLEGPVTHSISMKPTFSAVNPEWVLVASA